MHTHSIHTASIILNIACENSSALIIKSSVLHFRGLMFVNNEMMRMFSEHTKAIADV